MTAAIAHNLIIGAGAIMKPTCDNQCTMHNVCITVKCKTPTLHIGQFRLLTQQGEKEYSGFQILTHTLFFIRDQIIHIKTSYNGT